MIEHLWWNCSAHPANTATTFLSATLTLTATQCLMCWFTVAAAMCAALSVHMKQTSYVNNALLVPPGLPSFIVNHNKFARRGKQSRDLCTHIIFAGCLSRVLRSINWQSNKKQEKVETSNCWMGTANNNAMNLGFWGPTCGQKICSSELATPPALFLAPCVFLTDGRKKLETPAVFFSAFLRLQTVKKTALKTVFFLLQNWKNYVKKTAFWRQKFCSQNCSNFCPIHSAHGANLYVLL